MFAGAEVAVGGEGAVPEPAAAALEFVAGYGGVLVDPDTAGIGTGTSEPPAVLKETPVPDALMNGVGVEVRLDSG